MASSSPKWLEKAKRLFIALSSAQFDAPYVAILLLLEMVLCLAILRFVPYTEIDWEAYMQEVETWQAGERDYRMIRGGTGPLVYPAGFLYLYGWLRRITNKGNDIAKAQSIFMAFYLVHTTIVLAIYTRVARRVARKFSDLDMQRAKLVWSWRLAMGLCCLSKRIHSIFLLRLFNDGPAMLLLFLAIWFFSSSSWRVGCLFFSLAVSIKMNILLFAPGLLLLLLQSSPYLQETVLCLGICASVQLVLGAPFLLTYPTSYIRKAFEFDRVFFYKWTVNWKFLSEEVFLSKTLSIILLVLHLAVLGRFAVSWLKTAKSQTSKQVFFSKEVTLSPEYIVYTLLLSNFVGICFARTLHYQFYSWYFHGIPFLLWMQPRMPLVVRLCLVATIEYAFNAFPATPTSSAVLQVAHLVILVGTLSQGLSGISILVDNSQKQE